MISTLAKSMIWAKAAGAAANIANNSHARRIVFLPSTFCAGPEYRRIPALVGWAKAKARPFHSENLSCAVPTLSFQPAWARRTRGLSEWHGRASAFAHPTALCAYLSNASSCNRLASNQLRGIIERHRAAEEIALRFLDPDGAQRLELGCGLDAFRHDAAVGVAREGNERGG